MRRLEDLPLWKLAVLNCGYRLVEFAYRGWLFGPALLDRMKALK